MCCSITCHYHFTKRMIKFVTDIKAWNMGLQPVGSNQCLDTQNENAASCILKRLADMAHGETGSGGDAVRKKNKKELRNKKKTKKERRKSFFVFPPCFKLERARGMVGLVSIFCFNGVDSVSWNGHNEKGLRAEKKEKKKRRDTRAVYVRGGLCDNCQLYV